jgi:hypothetical protein
MRECLSLIQVLVTSFAIAAKTESGCTTRLHDNVLGNKAVYQHVHVYLAVSESIAMPIKIGSNKWKRGK